MTEQMYEKHLHYNQDSLDLFIFTYLILNACVWDKILSEIAIAILSTHFQAD